MRKTDLLYEKINNLLELFIEKLKFAIHFKILPYCQYFFETYLDFWAISYINSIFVIYFKLTLFIISLLLILFKYLIIFLFFWQFIITLLIFCYEFLLYITKIHNKKSIIKKDPNYVEYLKFLKNFWYNFSYYIIKYYIKLEKKNKNIIFIFFRWILLITPFYWGSILLLIFFFFCIKNCVFLLRIASLDKKSWIVNIIFLIIDNFYQIFIIQHFTKFENIGKSIFNWGFGRFLYVNFIKVFNNLLNFLQKRYFYIWILWRRFYKFFRYKFFRLIKKKLIKKKIWILRYKRIIYRFKWLLKTIKIIKIIKLNLIYFYYFTKFKINNILIKFF